MPPVPDRWLVLSVPAPEDETVRSLWVECLMGLGARGVEEEGGHLRVYLPESSGIEAELRTEIPRRLRALAGAAEPPEIEVSRRAHADWEAIWKRGLGPRRITDRLTVAPSWDLPEPTVPGRVLVVDPGMAFGTAEHATTRGALRLLDRWVRPGDRLVDVGTGTGILAMAAVVLGAEDVIAIEEDPWAVHAARENLERNGIGERVRLRVARVGPGFLPGEGPFDGILANLETSHLLPLLSGFRTGIRPGGWVLVSGVLEEESGAFRASAASEGFHFREEDREEGWWSGVFTRSPDGASGGRAGGGPAAPPPGDAPSEPGTR